MSISPVPRGTFRGFLCCDTPGNLENVVISLAADHLHTVDPRMLDLRQDGCCSFHTQIVGMNANFCSIIHLSAMMTNLLFGPFYVYFVCK